MKICLTTFKQELEAGGLEYTWKNITWESLKTQYAGVKRIGAGVPVNANK